MRARVRRACALTCIRESDLLGIRLHSITTGCEVDSLVFLCKILRRKKGMKELEEVSARKVAREKFSRNSPR